MATCDQWNKSHVIYIICIKYVALIDGGWAVGTQALNTTVRPVIFIKPEEAKRDQVTLEVYHFSHNYIGVVSYLSGERVHDNVLTFYILWEICVRGCAQAPSCAPKSGKQLKMLRLHLGGKPQSSFGLNIW